MVKTSSTSSRRRSVSSSNYRLLIFCLGAVLGSSLWFFSDSSKNNKLSSSHDKNKNDQQSHVVSGAMHQVELYEYYENGHTTSWSNNEDFPSNSNLKVLLDSQLKSKGKIVDIGEAHSKALLHRGIWVAVLRPAKHDRHEILLLRRSAHLKSCPNAWGLCGEHSDPNESWEDTARRAIDEELQLSPNTQEGTPRTIINLMKPIADSTSNHSPSLSSRSGGGGGSSMLVQTPYTDLNRFDLQATGLLAVVISHEESLLIQPDEEVAELQWAPISKMQTIYACNKEISDLAKVVGQKLTQHGFL